MLDPRNRRIPQVVLQTLSPAAERWLQLSEDSLFREGERLGGAPLLFEASQCAPDTARDTLRRLGWEGTDRLPDHAVRALLAFGGLWWLRRGTEAGLVLAARLWAGVRVEFSMASRAGASFGAPLRDAPLGVDAPYLHVRWLGEDPDWPEPWQVRLRRVLHRELPIGLDFELEGGP